MRPRRRREPLFFFLRQPPHRRLAPDLRRLLEWSEHARWLRRPRLIGFVAGQVNNADAGSVSSGTLSFGSNTTSNNTLFAFVRLGGTTATVTCADNVNSGNYTKDFNVTNSTGGEQLYVFRKTGITGGATTITATIASGPATLRWAIGEYTFGGLNSVLDQHASSETNTSSNSIDSTATPTTTVAAEVVLGVFMTGAGITGSPAFTAGAGYTLRGPLGGSNANGSPRGMFEDKVVAATGTYNATCTMNIADSNRDGVVLTYYAQAAASFLAARPVVLGQSVPNAVSF